MFGNNSTNNSNTEPSYILIDKKIKTKAKKDAREKKKVIAKKKKKIAAKAAKKKKSVKAKALARKKIDHKATKNIETALKKDLINKCKAALLARNLLLKKSHKRQKTPKSLLSRYSPSQSKYPKQTPHSKIKVVRIY